MYEKRIMETDQPISRHRIRKLTVLGHHCVHKSASNAHKIAQLTTSFPSLYQWLTGDRGEINTPLPLYSCFAFIPNLTKRLCDSANVGWTRPAAAADDLRSGGEPLL